MSDPAVVVLKTTEACDRIDRVRRDEVANTLAAFLRGDGDRLQLWETLRTLLTAEPGVEDSYLASLREGLFLWPAPHPEHLREHDWQRLTREVAFLRSDLELPKHVSGWEEVPPELEQARLARWHFLGLAGAVLVGWYVGWWLPAVCTVGSFVWFSVWVSRRCAAHDALRFREMEKLWAFAPFACESDWLAHRHRIEGDRIPAYDPALHREPRPSRLTWVGQELCVVGIGVVLGGVYAASVLIWPLWIFLRAVMPPYTDNQAAREQSV